MKNHHNLIAPLILFLSVFAQAAQITQIKDNKVIVDLDNSPATVGGEYYTVSPSGKKTAIIKIQAIKNGKAVGLVTKGKAVMGSDIMAKSAAASASPAPPQNQVQSSNKKERSTVIKTRSGKMAAGALVGYAMNTMTLDIQATWSPYTKEGQTLTGNSFSLKGFLDYDLSRDFTIRAATGLETFSAKGSTSAAICGSQSAAVTGCEVGFNYLAFEGSIHWNILTGKSRLWLGAGYSFLYVMNKTANIPNLDTSVSTNQLALFSAGYDWALSGKSFIPVVVDYAYYPGSSTVKASSIIIRTGYGMSF